MPFDETLPRPLGTLKPALPISRDIELKARWTSETASDFRSSRDFILNELAKMLLGTPMMTSVMVIVIMNPNTEPTHSFYGACACLVATFLTEHLWTDRVGSRSPS